MKLLGETDFSGYEFRDATVVRNRVVYFGSWNTDRATSVLEQEKRERSLEVKSKFTPIDFIRAIYES